MDELITIKEDQVQQIQQQVEQANHKIHKYKSEQAKYKNLEDTIKYLEKKHTKELQTLQYELDLYKKQALCDPQISAHNSNNNNE